jgi:hypothetical protein
MKAMHRGISGWLAMIALAVLPLFAVLEADAQGEFEGCVVEFPNYWPDPNPYCCKCECQGCLQQTCQKKFGGAGGAMSCTPSWCNLDDPCMGTG